MSSADCVSSDARAWSNTAVVREWLDYATARMLSVDRLYSPMTTKKKEQTLDGLLSFLTSNGQSDMEKDVSTTVLRFLIKSSYLFPSMLVDDSMLNLSCHF